MQTQPRTFSAMVGADVRGAGVGDLLVPRSASCLRPAAMGLPSECV